MDRQKADAIFARYSEIGHAEEGTRLVVTDDMKASPCSAGEGVITLPKGTHLRVTSNYKGLLDVDAAQGAKTLRVRIGSDELHKLKIIQIMPLQVDTEPQVDLDHLNSLTELRAAASSVSRLGHSIDPRLKEKLLKDLVKEAVHHVVDRLLKDLEEASGQQDKAPPPKET